MNTLAAEAGIKHGEKTAEELIAENTGLVHLAVRRFTFSGVEYEDLYQIGCIGLIKAAKAFDYSRGVCFSTYAVPVILGEIKRFLRDDGPVKVSRGLKERAIKLNKARAVLTVKLGREPTIGEIAESVGISSEEAVAAFDVLARPVSMDAPIAGDDDSPMYDILKDEDREEEKIEKLALSEALSILKPEERKLIVLRYFQNRTQAQTGEAMKMSQVQVSRMEAKILCRLREFMHND